MRTGLLAIILGCAVTVGTVAAQPVFRVVTYNVENFFDCRDDSLKEDDEFLPEGTNRWTYSRYWRKHNALSKVVAALSETHIPDLIGLCEVENDSVLYDLTRRSALRTLGYRYVVTESPDRRGIDVALLYQPGTFSVLSTRSIRIPSAVSGFRPTRDLLYVCGRIVSGDTLHVWVCHLPSRAGHTRQSDRHRALAVGCLKQAMDSVRRVRPSARMLVMGDCNAGIRQKVLREVLGVKEYGRDTLTPDSAGELWALPLRCSEDVKGSYRYRGIWETIDHILVSGSLLDDRSSFRADPSAYRVAAFPFLCEPDATYGGLKPFRTYQGPVYKGGFSDHLPLVLDFVSK